MNGLEIVLANGAKFSGYFAAPAAVARGALVVVQEIYGVNREIRRVVDHFGKAGFAAVAPDLMWRVEPGLEFDYADRDNARKAVGSLDPAAIVADIVGSIAAIRAALPGADGLRVGLLALGWGGKFAFAAAAKSAVNAIASYYPGNLEGSIEMVRAVKAPLLFHFAARDERTKLDFRTALRTALADRDDVELYVYPQADHGFANRDRAEFHGPCARLADERTMGFLLRTVAREAS